MCLAHLTEDTMSEFTKKLKAASQALFEAEKELEVTPIGLPVAEASGILVAARHLIDRVASYAPPDVPAKPLSD
jgi:hypothetical protein